MMNSEDLKVTNFNWYIIRVKKGSEANVIEEIGEKLKNDNRELIKFVGEMK
jgi:hypothetical protein